MVILLISTETSAFGLRPDILVCRGDVVNDWVPSVFAEPREGTSELGVFLNADVLSSASGISSA